MHELVFQLASQGPGWALAMLFATVAYRKDRQVNRLNLRLLRMLNESRAQAARQGR